MERDTRKRRATAAAQGVAVLGSVLLLLSCASTPDPEPDPETDVQVAPAERETADPDEVIEEINEKVCVRNAAVTVRVYNKSTTGVRLQFGSYAPARIAEALERTNYAVARVHLDRVVRIEVARGGLQLGGPAFIPTEAVACNIATLVIGARPHFSVFYGDEIFEPVDLRAAQEEAKAAADSAAAVADSAAAAADSTATPPDSTGAG